MTNDDDGLGVEPVRCHGIQTWSACPQPKASIDFGSPSLPWCTSVSTNKWQFKLIQNDKVRVKRNDSACGEVRLQRTRWR